MQPVATRGYNKASFFFFFSREFTYQKVQSISLSKQPFHPNVDYATHRPLLSNLCCPWSLKTSSRSRKGHIGPSEDPHQSIYFFSPRLALHWLKHCVTAAAHHLWFSITAGSPKPSIWSLATHFPNKAIIRYFTIRVNSNVEALL